MWNELWERHKGRLIGVASGLLLGIIYLISGFWDMLIFAFIVAVCFYAGGKFDAGRFRLNADEWLGKISRLADRWKWFR
ncbi:DUF2273 domain-containing protein [Paenibacillus flagellatus]|uniref:DUF2273 domain-containing protein n=1 Tax=Paenibacillus flagellatus TaxID=2211139 RepID=A0A2V5K880_9BACL|nr:DUF2273 domain-containing protein [Paenibacillus flagellatus]PYI55052.1 hypothetical protein DLM86_10970 [Paenibacillus flagellatus]